MTKRIFCLLAALLAFAVLFTGCNNDAEIICQNCASAVLSDSQFCPNCGAAFIENSTRETTQETTGSTESTAPVETESNAETAPASDPTTPSSHSPATNTHTHNFSSATCTKPQTCACGATSGSPLGHSYTVTVTPATCTSQGYTAHTCTCGDSYRDNYTTASHQYQNYICTSCGSVDKAHAYEHLINWTIANGTANGIYSEVQYWYSDQCFAIYYNADEQHLAVELSFTSNDQVFYSSVFLNDYYYTTRFDNNRIAGFLNAATFTSNTPLTYTSYTGDQSVKQDIAELAIVAICDMLDWLDWYLVENNVGINIADLGFAAY